jgi:hypothetical protein
MEALIAAIPVSTEEVIVVLLYRPVRINIALKVVESRLILVYKSLWA